jgi:hypothetical protein
MALASTALFASYDLTDKVQAYDISPFLSEALLYDFSLIGHVGMNGDPLDDNTYYWQEDVLNSDTLTLTISLGTSDTSITHSASTAPHVGDLVTVTGISNLNQEIMQITAVNSSTNSTVSRGYAATTAASIASSGTVALQRLEQEGSDISADASVNPTVRSNYTSIIPGRDLQITGTQLARRMSATAFNNQVSHQLENRLKEWKRSFTRSLINSPKSAVGSDTNYSSFGGIRYWINNAAATAQKYTTAGAFTLANLDVVNTACIDLGADPPDTLLVGTDLVGSINGFAATNRQLLESDTKVGHIVTHILLAQGNVVQVIVDNRVQKGQAFLFPMANVKPRPLNGRNLVTIAGSDWVDGVKRRILGEWGCEVRNPEGMGSFISQT